MKLHTLLISLSLTCNSFAQTTISDSLDFGGLSRKYDIYIPTSYSNTNPAPVVFSLHGLGSNTFEQKVYADFRPIADTAGFLLVLPLGSIDPIRNETYWNARFQGSVDDVGFIDALIDTISSQYTIDSNQIFSAGLSNGGFMSYTLACELNERIAAIASVTGSMTTLQPNNCNITYPVPVMQIHGTADSTVLYNGTAGVVLSVDEVINFWVDKNNCDNTPIHTVLPNINTTDGCTAERFGYTNGTNNSEVALYKIIDGGHTWPGAPIDIGVTNRDFNASEEIWNFFRKHPKANIALGNNISKVPSSISVYPNPNNGVFTIDLKNHQNRAKIKLFDLTGKELIISYQEYDGQLQFNLANLQKGIYFITMEQENKTITQKLIIK